PSQHPIVAVASGDFNNDGTPDIALSTANPCPNDPNHLCGDNTIFIFRNNGNGTFTRVNSFNASLIGAQMRAADLNGDQNIDLLFFINGAETGTVDYVLGKGNGTFGTDFQIDQDTDVEIRDLDLDGRNDLVVTDAIFSNLNVKLARSGSINCAPPGSANLTAKICAPTTTTAASPVLVRGSGNSPLGVQRMEIWIDGKKAAQKLEDQISKKFTLAPGTHRIAVVAVDKYVGAATTVKNVTVH
ncbi:MAG TPA: VCBS repeat-containing protein, partial [Terriglobales bacterium]